MYGFLKHGVSFKRIINDAQSALSKSWIRQEISEGEDQMQELPSTS